MIAYESSYRAYIQARGVDSGPSSASYVSRLRRVSRLLGEDITPVLLNCEQDVYRIAAKVSGKIPDHALRDCISALHQYVAMVRDQALAP